MSKHHADRRFGFWLKLPMYLWTIMFVFVSLLYIIGLSFLQRDELIGVTDQVTLANYTRMADPQYVRVLWQSLRLAALTTVICTLIGYPFGYLMARLKPETRSVIMLRSWRESGGDVSSNIVWEYGHCTIPRHLRDIVVTEYGIADLRGKTDSKVIEALLNITDSRFQTELTTQAQLMGKLPKDFCLDPRFADNSPERLQGIAARHPHLFPEYPLGSDFSAQEQDLLRALNWLKSKFKLTQIYQLGKATLDAPPPQASPEHLERMQLAKPDGLRDELYQRLLLAGLQATAKSN